MTAAFTVRLTNFSGPFDLLLQLISRHKLDVTEVALSQVTDEFIAHLRTLGPDGDLDQTSSFIVVRQSGTVVLLNRASFVSGMGRPSAVARKP